MMKMLSVAFLGLTLLSLQTIEGQYYSSYGGSYVPGYYSVYAGYVQKHATHLPFIPVYGGVRKLLEPSVTEEVPTYSPEDVYEYTNDLDDVPTDTSNNSTNVGDTDQNDSDFNDTSFNDTSIDDTNNDDEDNNIISPPSNKNGSKRLCPTSIVMAALGLFGYCMVCM